MDPRIPAHRNEYEGPRSLARHVDQWRQLPGLLHDGLPGLFRRRAHQKLLNHRGRGGAASVNNKTVFNNYVETHIKTISGRFVRATA